MPVTTDEKTEQIKKARNELIAAVSAEEGRPENVITNAQAIASGIADYLKDKSKTIHEKVKSATAEISQIRSKAVQTKDAATREGIMQKVNQARLQARVDLTDLIDEMRAYLEDKYIIVLSQYDVRIAGKYIRLLRLLEETKEVKKMKSEFALYEKTSIHLFSEVSRWEDWIRKTIQPKLEKIRDFTKAADIIDAFVKEHEGKMKELSVLIEKQSQKRLQRAISIANEMIGAS